VVKHAFYIAFLLAAYCFSANILAPKYLLLPGDKIIVKEDETHKKRFFQYIQSSKREKTKEIKFSSARKLKGLERGNYGVSIYHHCISISFTNEAVTLPHVFIPNAILTAIETRGPPAMV